MPEETRSATLNIRLKPSIKKAAAKKAASQNRSLTTYIEWLILQDIKKAQWPVPADVRSALKKLNSL